MCGQFQRVNSFLQNHMTLKRTLCSLHIGHSGSQHRIQKGGSTILTRPLFSTYIYFPNLKVDWFRNWLVPNLRVRVSSEESRLGYPWTKVEISQPQFFTRRSDPKCQKCMAKVWRCFNAVWFGKNEFTRWNWPLQSDNFSTAFWILIFN